MPEVPHLNKFALQALVREALAEDIGQGDATTLAVVPAAAEVSAALRCREACVVAGLPVVEAVFRELDPAVEVRPTVREGQAVDARSQLAAIAGPARAVITGERTALNFLQHLSGIATLTRKYVDAVAGTAVKLLDTRKTTPCQRGLEKYAVRCGGGHNHRFGLYDRVMIKDNHLQVARRGGGGTIAAAVAAAQAAYPDLEVEVEADTLAQVAEALEAGADYVLLDNMGEAELAEAHLARQELAPGCRLEASGGVALETIATLAATGIDFISVGRITHSAPAIDIGLDIAGEPPV